MSKPPPGGLDLERFRKTAAPSVHHVPVAGPAADPFSIVAKERRVQEVLASIESLPSLPTVVIQALRLTNSRESQASDFEEIIRNDQALAAKVLKLANSPFFGLRSKVNSISQAVVVLGLKTMRSVVIAAKTSRLLSGQLTTYGFDATGMWKHSIGCAAVSRLVAQHVKLGSDVAEEMFVAGLLHDVGKTVLAPHVARFQDEFTRRFRESGDLIATERDLVGISHAEVGGKMAEQWSLDARLQFFIQNHHDESTGDRALVTVQLANDFCNQLGIGREDGPLPAAPGFPGRLRKVGIPDGAELAGEVAAKLDEVLPVFESLGAE